MADFLLLGNVVSSLFAVSCSKLLHELPRSKTPQNHTWTACRANDVIFAFIDPESPS